MGHPVQHSHLAAQRRHAGWLKGAAQQMHPARSPRCGQPGGLPAPDPNKEEEAIPHLESAKLYGCMATVSAGVCCWSAPAVQANAVASAASILSKLLQ